MFKFAQILLITSFTYGAVLHVPDDYPTIQEGIDAATTSDSGKMMIDLFDNKYQCRDMIPSCRLVSINRKKSNGSERSRTSTTNIIKY